MAMPDATDQQADGAVRKYRDVVTALLAYLPGNRTGLVSCCIRARCSARFQKPHTSEISPRQSTGSAHLEDP